VDIVSYEAPGFGVGELALRGTRPVHHDLPLPRRRPGARHLPATACDPDAGDPAERLVGRVARFFAGQPVGFDAGELGLAESCEEWGLTGFGCRAALALAEVPYGALVSYGELAGLAGAPRAARAAGTFCAGNPLGLFIPCHRVVRSDGSPGEFGSYGTRYKQRLLRLEAQGSAA
jgi:methylated-DNA-[protein]-cysteine S-methyltransferase